MNYEKETWQVLDSYFKSNPYFISKHHLESYNDFVSNKITSIIKSLNPILTIKNQDNGNITHEIEVYIGGLNTDEIFLYKPTVVENDKQRVLYPNEARLKDFTYQSDITANVTVRYITKEGTEQPSVTTKVFENMKIGALPIMLHSKLCVLHDLTPDTRREMGECKWDQGGYFIIDGKEKVIVSQERIATNRIFISRSKDPKFSYEGLIRCTSEQSPFPKVVMFFVNTTKTLDPIDELMNIQKEEKEAEKKTKKDDDEDDNDGDDAEEGKEGKKKKEKRLHNAIMVQIPYCSVKIPLFVLFRLLGIESDKEILEYIFNTTDDIDAYLDFMRPSIVAGSKFFTQEDCMSYVANFVEYKNIDNVKKILIYDLFPNIGENLRNKAIFLGHIIKKLVDTVIGVSKVTDRDSYIFKRVDISGFLLGNIFRDYYNQFRNVIRNNIDNQYLYGPWRNSKNIENLINPTNMRVIFNPDILENGLKKSLKGMWGKSMVTGSIEFMKQGLVQDLSRLSYLGFISHLRRVNCPIDPTSKVVEPHKLHSTQWGIMCPCESPDGASIGLVKNFAILCHVTFDIPVKSVLTHMEKLGLQTLLDVSVGDMYNQTRVFINSNLIGIVKDPVYFVRVLRLLRRNAIIHPFTSISWNIIANEIQILTESGRCCRPLYIVHNGELIINKYIDDIRNKKKTWNDFFKPTTSKATYDIDELEKTMSPIEYIDVEETNCSLIAMVPSVITKTSKHTHCEIHPSTIFSVLTLNIPLSQHNQAPRNIFSGAQGKQAIGVYATNFNDRIDTMAYVLHYPQRAIINTRYMQYLRNNDMPHGENLIVAIATYTGYNQEDSIIINRNSIERGCFNLTYFKDMIQAEESDEYQNIMFMNTPDMIKKEGKEVEGVRLANYTTIDEHGYPKVNSHIKEGDAIFGRCVTSYEMVDDNENDALNIFNAKVKKEKYRDMTVIADKTVSGVIDKVFVFETDAPAPANKACKVRFRKVRQPELGDKLCSRTAQKGVIGMIIPQENMPFNKDGIVPDIIINPHAFPTRMTLGHLLECLLAKTGVYMGTCIDGTPFTLSDYTNITDLLETKFGLEKNGNEILYSGVQGNQMECDIFFGPTYYERLKHMVADKMNYRNTGPITNKTRQPTKGRGNGGGLRIGEMERDSLLSHGVTNFLKESLMERSDIHEFLIDKNTGFIADKKGLQTCPLKAPFAFKLLLQEILSMGVKPQLIFEEKQEEDDYMYGVHDDDEIDYESEMNNLNTRTEENDDF